MSDVLCLILMFDFSDAELPTAEEDLHQMQETVEKEKDRLHMIRMQLAKKNRAIVSIERKLDNIPDRTELAQYQRRFIELYSQGKLIDGCENNLFCAKFWENSSCRNVPNAKHRAYTFDKFKRIEDVE